MKQILYCKNCGKYTLKATCFICGLKTLLPAPAKYSPDDKYAKYRQMAKEQQ